MSFETFTCRAFLGLPEPDRYYIHVPSYRKRIGSYWLKLRLLGNTDYLQLLEIVEEKQEKTP